MEAMKHPPNSTVPLSTANFLFSSSPPIQDSSDTTLFFVIRCIKKVISVNYCQDLHNSFGNSSITVAMIQSNLSFAMKKSVKNFTVSMRLPPRTQLSIPNTI